MKGIGIMKQLTYMNPQKKWLDPGMMMFTSTDNTRPTAPFWLPRPSSYLPLVDSARLVFSAKPATWNSFICAATNNYFFTKPQRLISMWRKLQKIVLDFHDVWTSSKHGLHMLAWTQVSKISKLKTHPSMLIIYSEITWIENYEEQVYSGRP